MSTHNICFYEELTKIILELSSNTLLICSTDYSNYCYYTSYTANIKGTDQNARMYWLISAFIVHIYGKQVCHDPAQIISVLSDTCMQHVCYGRRLILMPDAKQQTFNTSNPWLNVIITSLNLFLVCL